MAPFSLARAPQGTDSPNSNLIVQFATLIFPNSVTKQEFLSNQKSHYLVFRAANEIPAAIPEMPGCWYLARFDPADPAGIVLAATPAVCSSQLPHLLIRISIDQYDPFRARPKSSQNEARLFFCCNEARHSCFTKHLDLSGTR